MGRNQWSQSARRRKTSALTVHASERFVLGSKILACLSNLRCVNFWHAQESPTVRLFQTIPSRWVWSLWLARIHGSQCDSLSSRLGQILISYIKGEGKKKHQCNGWSFSCFAAHLFEQDPF